MCSFITTLKTRSSCRSNNYDSFKVVMNINNILRYLPQLEYDMKISVFSVGAKVSSAANISVVCHLYSQLKEMITFI